jgi:hypothetical protein
LSTDAILEKIAYIDAPGNNGNSEILGMQIAEVIAALAEVIRT